MSPKAQDSRESKRLRGGEDAEIGAESISHYIWLSPFGPQDLALELDPFMAFLLYTSWHAMRCEDTLQLLLNLENLAYRTTAIVGRRICLLRQYSQA